MKEEQTRGDFQELSEMFSALRLLVEVAYANAFAADPEGFARVMAELQRLTREAPVRSGPMPDETLIELQARIATHLQRFQQAVQHRIGSGKRV
jgi:hypothetical protein